MFLPHVCYWWITQITSDGSHKLLNTHHGANLLSAAKITANYSIIETALHTTGHLAPAENQRISSRQPPVLPQSHSCTDRPTY